MLMGKIHLIGLPHTQLDDNLYSSCAFTAKAFRTVKMIRATGRDVVTYWGGDQSDVSLMSVEDQIKYFGEWDPGVLPVIIWDKNLEYWKTFHSRALEELKKRLKPNDIIALVGGGISQEIVDEFYPQYTVIEPGVGYGGICRNTFACFESYAWMHDRYGAYGIGDGRAFDTVIPNAVDPEEWHTAESQGYALFVGRLIARKGPHVAAQIANAAGLKLIMAGAGVKEKSEGRVVATDGTVVEGDIEHIGPVIGRDRAKLFAEAEVFICPTLYIGPWEGVHAESMMSGVGVCAPDYGVFTETLPKPYRYRNLRQAIDAVDLARKTRGEMWRKRSIEMFSIDRCTEMYDEWLDRIESLRDGRNGWYSGV